jgi:hypothetical protein
MCIYMTPLELILSKIPDLVKCRACGAAHLPASAATAAFPPDPFSLAAAAFFPKNPPKSGKICKLTQAFGLV